MEKSKGSEQTKLSEFSTADKIYNNARDIYSGKRKGHNWKQETYEWKSSSVKDNHIVRLEKHPHTKYGIKTSNC